MSKRKIYFEREERVVRSVKGFIEIDMEYKQVYEGLRLASDEINSVCAFKLLLFLLFEISNTNIFVFDKLLIEKFNNTGKSVFHERTIRYALSELVKAGIIHKISNGRYWVDPRYVWGDKTDKRLSFIRNLEEWNRSKLIGDDVKIIDDNSNPTKHEED